MARYVSIGAVGLARMVDEMAKAALTGVAQAVSNQAKLNARHGFRSGQFITNGWSSIGYRVEGAPRYKAVVGSTLKHFMFWEMGHHNLFVTKGAARSGPPSGWTFVRNRWLSAAFETTRPQQQALALNAVSQVARRYGVAGQAAYRAAKGLVQVGPQ